MCEESICLLKLSPTRGRGNAGQDVFILKLTSGSFLKSGESITTVPLDTFWNGIRELVSYGVVPLISSWRNGNVGGLKITWPLLRNCTTLVLDSDSMIRLQVRRPLDEDSQRSALGNERYYVPTDTHEWEDIANPV